jgi:cytochrome b
MCFGLPPPRSAPRVYVWDLPTRLFHWSLALLVVGAFVTQKIGGNAMVWHGRIGLAILGLLVFRIVWGFAGSTYARFTAFVRGPSAIRDYLAGRWQGLGHNPLGALSVLALLSVLAWLAATGLFANDDIAFEGPLYALIGKAGSDRLTGLHKFVEPLLILVVLLHIGAIAFYARVKKDNLVKPMLSGWKDGATGENARGGSFIAFLVAAAIAGGAVAAASGLWLPAPPPPPPAAPSSGPSW